VEPRALLVVGPYGSGKSTVGTVIADMLEAEDRAYALLDLDFLAWANPPSHDVHGDPRILLANLASLIATYRDEGIEEFVLAGYVETRDELDRIRDVIGMPLVVIGLQVPWREIRRRLEASLGRGGSNDLQEAAGQVAESRGRFEDVVVNNDRPPLETAKEIVERIGWRSS
jgi:energy-coupling factor transporter ATP-binding protein EcfA2